MAYTNRGLISKEIVGVGPKILAGLGIVTRENGQDVYPFTGKVRITGSVGVGLNFGVAKLGGFANLWLELDGTARSLSFPKLNASLLMQVCVSQWRRRGVLR